jgi:hypothetical protein
MRVIVRCPYCQANSYDFGIYKGYGNIFCEKCKSTFNVLDCDSTKGKEWRHDSTKCKTEEKLC